MDIKAEILDYISCNETTGALLLTGPWGCGKSYLLKQIAKELNDERKAAVAVISLFGLDSISAINKRVKDEYMAFKLGTMGKAARKISKGFATLAKDGLAVAGVATPGAPGLAAASKGLSSVLSYDIFGFIEVQNSVGNDDKKRKFILAFDDLERCGICNKQDLLGAINDFVENKQIKVIIVADEAKIGDEGYKEYKEKLISRTIRMSADYYLLIDSIVENYNEANKGYKGFLIENSDLLKQVFFESNTNNIRTLKCILADFERVYAAWKETNVPTDNMKWALYTFGAEVFLSKTPKKEEATSKKASSSIFGQEKEKQYVYKGKNRSAFSSCGKWINYGIWDKERFIDELNSKYLEKDETPLYRFLTYGFWDLRQQDIDDGLPQAVQLAYDGKLSKDQLITLIGKVHALKENAISLPVDVDYQKIEAGFDKRFNEMQKGTVNEPKSHTFIEKSGVDEGALDLLRKIERFDDRIAAAENRSTYLHFLSGDDMVSYYSLKGSYVEEFDDEWLKLFIEKYESADNSGKRELALSLLGMVYDFNLYSTEENIQHTKENFDKLANHLEKMDAGDSITKIINQSFVREISNKFGNE